MTRERLEQLQNIEAALKIIKADIEKLEDKYHSCSQNQMSDRVKGSMPEFPYIAVSFPIVGVDTSAADKIYRKLKCKELELQEELLELEYWLDDIEDMLVYDIFRLRYRNNMTFEQIGEELGYDRSTISKLHKNYLKLRE